MKKVVKVLGGVALGAAAVCAGYVIGAYFKPIDDLDMFDDDFDDDDEWFDEEISYNDHKTDPETDFREETEETQKEAVRLGDVVEESTETSEN